MKTASYQQFISKGVLLLLDAPQHLQLGIDNLSVKIGSKFKGIKMMPLGIHYLHFSLRQEDHMFKISQFILFTEEDKIKVLKWSEEAQDFINVNKGDEGSYIEGVKQLHFDCYLVPYDNEKHQIWQETCCFITKRVLSKLDPIVNIQTIQQQYGHKNIENVQQNIMIDENEQQPFQEEIKDEKNQPGVANFKVMKGTIFYSEIPKKLKHSSSNTTDINLDKTQLLKRVLFQQYKQHSIDILGEMQYAFVSFLLGENLESFEQWKKLLNLISFSQEGIKEYLELYLNFVIVIFNQIKQLPADFFRDELSKDSFLVGCLIRLQEYAQDESVNKKFRDRLKKLFEMIKLNFKYEIPIEDDEDMPTVVENYDYL